MTASILQGSRKTRRKRGIEKGSKKISPILMFVHSVKPINTASKYTHRQDYALTSVYTLITEVKF